MKRELICIVCPRGCHLVVDENMHVTGNYCPRGPIYAIRELTDPRRTVTSTVRIISKLARRLPVKTSAPIPKGLMFDCMKALDSVLAKAPVHIGDVLIRNVLGTDCDVVATKNVEE